MNEFPSQARVRDDEASSTAPERGGGPDAGRSMRGKAPLAALQVPLMSAPPLTGLAAAAALVDLAANRLWLRGAAGNMSHATLVEISRWGGLVRNCAAIFGFVALCFALVQFLRPRGYAPVLRRIGIAAMAGVFLPTVALATLLPMERTSPPTVLCATGAASTLVVLLGLTALRWRPPSSLRVAMGAVSASALLAFCALAVALFGPMLRWSHSYVVASSLRRAGEFAYLVLPIAIAATMVKERSPRTTLKTLVAVVAGATVGVSVYFASLELGRDFSSVFYGALRLELFLDAAPGLYAIPVGLMVAVAGVGFGSPVAATRQAAAAVVLFLAAGYAPSSVGVLMMMVLGASVLARAAIAHAVIRSVENLPPRSG